VISLIGGALPGVAPVTDLVPTGSDLNDPGSPLYSIMANPDALCCGGLAGNRTIYIIETYDAFGVSYALSLHCTGFAHRERWQGNTGIDIVGVPVVFT
jgi:hypothetical protein